VTSDVKSSTAGTLVQTSFKINGETHELKLIIGFDLKLSRTFSDDNLGDLLIFLVSKTFPDSEEI
jgi:hypothetical protein